MKNDEVLQNAMVWGQIWYSGLKRKYTHEPFIQHPLRVCMILEQNGLGDCRDRMAAALLHDVLEDTPITAKLIGDRVSGVVRLTVQHLTTPPRPEARSRAEHQAIERLRFATVAGKDAKIIKLADIQDNLKDIWQFDPKFASVWIPEKIALLESCYPREEWEFVPFYRDTLKQLQSALKLINGNT